MIRKKKHLVATRCPSIDGKEKRDLVATRCPHSPQKRNKGTWWPLSAILFNEGKKGHLMAAKKKNDSFFLVIWLIFCIH
jgi:hypothetical protein